MPVLELPEGPSTSPSEQLLFVATFSVMLYPRSEKARAYWIAATNLGGCLEQDEPVLPPELLESIQVLWNSPQAPKRIISDGLARLYRGLLSGQVLLYLLVTMRHHQRHCKIERAKAFVAEYPLRGGPKVSESLIEKSWAEFKTVAHLWAAQMAFVSATGHPEHHSDEAWLPVLSLAEAFRERGQDARVLPAEQMWTVSDARVPRKSDLEIPPLPADRLAFLDSSFPR